MGEGDLKLGKLSLDELKFLFTSRSGPAGGPVVVGGAAVAAATAPLPPQGSIRQNGIANAITYLDDDD